MLYIIFQYGLERTASNPLDINQFRMNMRKYPYDCAGHTSGWFCTTWWNAREHKWRWEHRGLWFWLWFIQCKYFTYLWPQHNMKQGGDRFESQLDTTSKLKMLKQFLLLLCHEDKSTEDYGSSCDSSNLSILHTCEYGSTCSGEMTGSNLGPTPHHN